MKAASVILALAALIASAAAQTPMLQTGGAAPDVVGIYNGPMWIGATTATSLFAYQPSSGRSGAQAGVVLSHQCNADGSFDAVWNVNIYNSSGLVTSQEVYCEHGMVIPGNGTYMSYYQQTTTCPMGAPYDSATLRSMTVVPGSNLGALTMEPYCNSMFNMTLLHPASSMPMISPAPAPASSAAGRKLL